MSSFSGGYSISPISSSNIVNFYEDVAAIVESIGDNDQVGLIEVTTSGSNLAGKGQITDPLYLSDQITVTDVHTNNLSSSGQITASLILASQITSSFSGSGAGLYCLTASGIKNFTNDVRSQITAGTNINITSGIVSTNNVPTYNDITGVLTSYATLSGVSGTLTASYALLSGSQITGTFSGSGAGLYNLTASSINNFMNDVRSQFTAGTNITISSGVISTINVPTLTQITSTLLDYATLNGVSGTYATLSGVSGTFTTPTQVSSSITSALNPYATLTGLSGAFAQQTSVSASITSSLIPYATLSGVSGTFVIPSQVSSSITSALTPYATLTGVSASFTTPTQVSSSITSALVPYATLTGVSGTFVIPLQVSSSITSALTSYATLSGVSASFTTPLQVSSSITSALNPYATLAGVSGAFALLSGSQITGTFSGSGTGLYNLTASSINNFTNDVRSQFTAGTNITITSGAIACNTVSQPTLNIVTVSSSYNISATDCVILGSGSGAANYNINLPTAVGRAGKIYYIKNLTASSNIIIKSLGGTIDTVIGSTGIPMSARGASGGQNIVISDGTNWWLLGTH